MQHVQSFHQSTSHLLEPVKKHAWLLASVLRVPSSQVEEEDELDLISPVSQLGEVEAKILGPETGVLGGLSVILNLSPPLAANGFLAVQRLGFGRLISSLRTFCLAWDVFLWFLLVLCSATHSDLLKDMLHDWEACKI